MIYGNWLEKIEDNWYYLDGDGKMVTGEYQVGDVKYYFNADGSLIG
ncbi:hypothetical protein [Agathobacter sp.]